ncbi:uncharacterized protein LOC131619913 [Vicia villosa]|uniref:uncharacterized protein LOC131619913 n=1 Tax=Vicia villosa TaxID=3911 RepID=UPI00273BA02D|nr:uncharacterized protein LOC131619913 [Vicia villosa]
MADEVLYLCDSEPAASASSTDSCSDLMQYFVTDIIFESRDKVLEWARAFGNKIMRRKNYKQKNEVAAPSDGNSTMRLKCLFRLRYDLSGTGWKVVVKCRMHNHRLDKDLLGHDILDRLKGDERKFVNDMTKYNMAPRYRLPLLEIFGVTSTKLTFSVAFAYLEHEREENFTWALKRL